MILHLFRSNLRRRWVSTLVLILLVGVSLGITMGSTIGARRTATAFPRFAEKLSVPDLTVYVGADAAKTGDIIREQPQVATAGIGTGVGLMPRLPDGSPDFEHALGAVVGDGVFGVAVDQPLLLEGRLPADDAPLEIMLDEKAAEIADALVGDTFPASAFDVGVIMEKSEEFERSGREPTDADLAEVFTPVDLEVVGIGRTSGAVLVNEAVSEDSAALLSPAYGQRFPHTASYTVAVVDLVDRASAGDYLAAVRGELPGIDVGPTDLSGKRTAFAAAVRPYWLALAFFAAVFGLGAVLALGPTVVRVVDEELADRRTLRALGAGRRQLMAIAAVRPVAIGLAGVAVAVAVALGVSSLFPIGPARAAEPDRGVDVHLSGLAAGATVVVAAVVCAALLRAAVLTRTASARRLRPSALVSAAGAAGLSPTALTALHAAFAAGGDRSRRRLASAGIVGALAMAVAGWFPSAALAAVRNGTTIAEFEERHFISALGVQRPGDIRSYDGVDGVPTVLAAVLGALGISVLVHLVVGSVRQRRHELAILRTIGLRPRQVAATVLLQTTTQVLAILVVAVPLGVAAGRLSWRWFADGIGVEPDPSTPFAVIGVAFVAVLVAAALVALAPARRAASVRPVPVLRAE